MSYGGGAKTYKDMVAFNLANIATNISSLQDRKNITQTVITKIYMNYLSCLPFLSQETIQKIDRALEELKGKTIGIDELKLWLDKVYRPMLEDATLQNFLKSSYVVEEKELVTRGN